MRIKDLHKSGYARLDVGDGATAAFTTEIAIPDAASAHIGEDTPLVLCRQTHSHNIAIVDAADIYPQDVDALITRIPGLAIGVRTADCVPIVISAPDIESVAAVHAGWRGTLGRLVALTVEKMQALGADPLKMHAAIGPAICTECYEVDHELGARFEEEGLGDGVVREGEAKPHLDLKGINRRLLIETGIPADHIRVSDICTRHTLFDGVPPEPSYRREHGTELRMVTLISTAGSTQQP